MRPPAADGLHQDSDGEILLTDASGFRRSKLDSDLIVSGSTGAEVASRALTTAQKSP